MKFYIQLPKGDRPKNMSFPCCILLRDEWNDHGYRTTYSLSFLPTNKQEIDLGLVKILHESEPYYDLQNEFTQLEATCCSLGQDLKYYESLRKQGPALLLEVTNALNDVIAKPLLLQKFGPLEGFEKSLNRDRQADEVLKFGHKFFDKIHSESKGYPFQFSCTVKGAAAPHKVGFAFESNPKHPSRIVALVGKNGTGKTAVLGALCKALKEKEVTFKSTTCSFSPEPPRFTRVFGISYSLFDHFPLPMRRPIFDGGTPKNQLYKNIGGYFYLGLRDKGGFESEKTTSDKIKHALVRIRKLGRQAEWQTVMEKLLGVNASLIAKGGKSTWRKLQELSSGQSMIVAIFTELLADIQDGSLLLFDEPETHLHPNAIANLMIALNALLDQFNSYAIISTHSPLVIQEVPARQIRVFRREGTYPTVSGLEIESFGENLSNIANQVFDVTPFESFFREYFKKLVADGLSFEEIEDQFANKLSLNARVFLNSLRAKTDEKA